MEEKAKDKPKSKPTPKTTSKAKEKGIEDQFDKIFDELEDVQVTTVSGRITEIVGMLIRAVVPRVKIGELCLVKRENAEPLQVEVV